MNLNWTSQHPTEPGYYLLSIEPGKRNPAPWVTLPAVMAIYINAYGDVQVSGSDEPAYNIADIPPYCSTGHRWALLSDVSDPWAGDQ